MLGEKVGDAMAKQTPRDFVRRARISRRRLLSGVTLSTAALGASWLTGCSTQSKGGAARQGVAASSSPESPKTGGTLNVYLNFNPPLDPHKISASAQDAPGGAMSRLFRFKTGVDPKAGTDHELENDLGVSAESPDAVTWTIKLRPDGKFQNIPPVNGHPAQAEDVKATFTRALDPAVPNPNRGSLDMIDVSQIQTPASDTVVFKLNYPYAPFRQTLASAIYSWIFPREVLAGSYDPSKTVIGTGACTLESVTPDVAYIYRRNPDWFEKGRPYVDGVRLAIIPDRAQQLAQFGAGNIDELLLDDPNEVDAAKQSSPKAGLIKAENAAPQPLYFQMGDASSVFQDIRVRRAFSMAIDRDTIGKAIYRGEAEQMLFIPSYMGKWALKVQDLPQDMQQYYKYNPSEAKQLLQAAGQSNLQLKLAYPNTFGTPIYAKHAETVANMLNAVGVKTTIVVQDYNKDFVDAGKGSRQGYFDKDTMMFAAAAVYSEADEWLFGYLHSRSTANQERLHDPTYDAMVDKARTLVNEDERLKAVLDIERYLADKMYLVPTVGTYRWVLLHPRVQSYQYSTTHGKMAETYAKLWLSV